MATVHFSKIVKLRTEAHDITELNRTYLHLLLDTEMYSKVVSHEEVVLVFDGNRQKAITDLIEELKKYVKED